LTCAIDTSTDSATRHHYKNMVRPQGISRLATFLVTSTSIAAAQTDGSAVSQEGASATSESSVSNDRSVSSTLSSLSPTASPAISSASPTTTSDVPLELWGIAESLLSSYYPSTTVTQVASLTWPTAVVIDGSTHSVHSAKTGGISDGASSLAATSSSLVSSTSTQAEATTPAPTRETDDVISPIMPPARNPERIHSPMVHYPSWSEISEFDFSGDGRRRNSMRGQYSFDHDDDGWRPVRGRDSIVGRHELA